MNYSLDSIGMGRLPENPVVRPNKIIIPGFNSHRFSVGSHPWIHHHAKDAPLGEIPQGPGQNKGAMMDILGPDSVGQINDPGTWTD